MITLKNRLLDIVELQKQNKAVGIYSCCSSNKFVIQSCIQASKKNNSLLLIESTANQVDQYGGYTGMKPEDFKLFVYKLADDLGFDREKIILGGDHLGPLTFASKTEDEAMREARQLVRSYVLAGFTKIHIDTSMRVADDDVNIPLSDEVISRRGAELVQVCEEAYLELLSKDPNAIEPVYIIGSEVPIPGGSLEGANDVQVTNVTDLKNTIIAFKSSFVEHNLNSAWERVIGIVVQPGVEENDNCCVEYNRDLVKDLKREIKKHHLIFECHSTDYQTRTKLRELVEDGFAILKVGPALTFAFRESLVALELIEKELYGNSNKDLSRFTETLEEEMLKSPGKWIDYYKGTEQEKHVKRLFSFCDRCRYYFPNSRVDESINRLLNNVKEIPLSLLSQFFPNQFKKVRNKMLLNSPEEIILDRIRETVDDYLFATHQNEIE